MSCQEALRNVVVIQPLITIWSGEVTINRSEDLKSASGLPPDALVSDGSKRIVDPKVLTPLSTHRRCTQRDLTRIGVRTAIGFVIQPDRKDEALKLLDERKQLFDADASNFLLNYDTYCKQQEAKYPEYKALLQNKRPTAQYVAGKCSFEYAYFKVAPSDNAGGDQQFEVIAKATTSALAEDIATNAEAILGQLKSKDRALQRTVDMVRELVAKLEGFTMFDPRIGPSANALQDVLDGLPTSGALHGTHLLVLRAMLTQMADPEELLNVGTAQLEAAATAARVEAETNVAVTVQSAPATNPQPVATSHSEEADEYTAVVF